MVVPIVALSYDGVVYVAVEGRIGADIAEVQGSFALEGRGRDFGAFCGVAFVDESLDRDYRGVGCGRFAGNEQEECGNNGE